MHFAYQAIRDAKMRRSETTTQITSRLRRTQIEAPTTTHKQSGGGAMVGWLPPPSLARGWRRGLAMAATEEGKGGAGSPPAFMTTDAWWVCPAGLCSVPHPATVVRGSSAGCGVRLVGNGARPGGSVLGRSEGQPVRLGARGGKRGRKMSRRCWRRELMGHGPFTCVRPKPANGYCVWVKYVGDSLIGLIIDDYRNKIRD